MNRKIFRRTGYTLGWVAAMLLTALALVPLLRFGCTLSNIVAHRKFGEDASRQIRHVVIVVQENRSFDNLFHRYPGADTVDYGISHDGTRVRLQPVSLAANYDIANSYRDFEQSYDRGRMDGYDLRVIGPRPRTSVPLAALEYPQYAFVPPGEVGAYWNLAHRFVLADHMFQSNIDQSFAAHLYLIAGQANRSTGIPTGRPWGCDAGLATRVDTLTTDRKLGKNIFPCFDFRTLADELDAKGLTWAYYAPKVDPNKAWRRFSRSGDAPWRHPELGPNFGQLWSAFDAVAHTRFGPAWGTNVRSPSFRVFTDIERGTLANVTWIVPDWKNSDHAFSRSASGPLWVSSIVNAIGKSRFWNTTAILIVWDDSGGWYDHVPPPQLDYDGLGPRVPLLVISPYAKHGWVSHKQYEFGSLLRFTETVFGLPPLAVSDRRANDLMDCFAFDAPARPFTPLATGAGAQYFARQPPSARPPDDD